jgi:hypothetical protein
MPDEVLFADHSRAVPISIGIKECNEVWCKKEHNEELKVILNNVRGTKVKK